MGATNPLIELGRLGQSVWLDYLSREMIQSGKLKKLITEDGLSGVTSNPTLFHKAISSGRDYDDPLERLVEKGMRDSKELFLSLARDDVSDAADLLMQAHKDTGGLDGFVSIEVSPDLAYDADATIKEAVEIFDAIGRRNVLVKVPGTRPGLPAIEELTAMGVNVNVTLLFSASRYAEVADAYMKGIERRIREGKAVDGVVSVASFFVSRVDTLTDKYLEEAKDKDRAGKLKGRAAVANAKAAYRRYRDIVTSDRFRSIREKGGRQQRLLWGSSGTKNPAYSDIKYVQELIAPESINTMPEETLNAFRDHGEARVTIDDGMDAADSYFGELRAAGIDIEDIAGELEKDGVKKFSDSYFALLDFISEKKNEFVP